MDTSAYAAVASVAERCSKSIGLIWPSVECLLMLYRVTQRKTAAWTSPALLQRFRPFNVSRLNVGFNDPAAALSADVSTAPRDRGTPQVAAHGGELRRYVLRPVVGVEYCAAQPGSSSHGSYRPQRVGDQSRAHVISDGPAGQAFRVQVHTVLPIQALLNTGADRYPRVGK